MNGSKMMYYRVSMSVIMMLLSFPSLHAEESSTTESPSIDFLEFLGEWETEEGEWIDPVELENEAYAILNEESEETNDAY